MRTDTRVDGRTDPAGAGREPVTAARHVLLAVDGTEASQRAARFVEEFLGAGADLKITAVNVATATVPLAPPVAFGGVYGWPWPAENPAVSQAMDDAMADERIRAEAVVVDQAPAGAEVDVRFGAVVDAILEAAADHDVDLIVLGHRQHGLLDRLLHESVSRGVTRQADFPVLIVN